MGNSQNTVILDKRDIIKEIAINDKLCKMCDSKTDTLYECYTCDDKVCKDRKSVV